MSPAQVVAASGGLVHAVPPQNRGAPGIETRAEGMFRSGPIELAVSFGFRRADGGLALVSYVATSATQNYAVRDYLVRKYGEPQPSGDADMGSAIWNTPGHDVVDLSLSDEGPAFVVQHPPGSAPKPK